MGLSISDNLLRLTFTFFSEINPRDPDCKAGLYS